MWEWITSNIANIVIVVILLAAVGLAAGKILRDRKNGKSSCGCNCGSCPMSGSCHKEGQKTG